MATKTLKELTDSLSAILGEAPSDDGIALLEDLNDTMRSLTGEGSANDWKQKFEENDKNWRKRYTERFNDPVNPDSGGNKNNEDNKPMTFEDLFKEVK